MRGFGSWLFRNRQTGAITIAQLPNLPLWGFFMATLVRWSVPLSTQMRDVVSGIALGFLAWWSLDEVARGVNPWRRILGSVAGAVVATMIVNRVR
jgi:hypothetical protein